MTAPSKVEMDATASVLQSPPKLGGDALAKRGLGRSVQSREATFSISAKRSLLIRMRYAEIYKDATRL